MKLTLRVWRQANAHSRGRFESYPMQDVSPEMSFLEMLDVLNEQLTQQGKEPIAFDHDCREGICGMCSLMINGNAHGPQKATTTCQLHMRQFKDGETITIEPFRAKKNENRFHFSWNPSNEQQGDMIHLLRQPATDQQVGEMLEVHETYIKVAVDIRRSILAGGGEFHADCESVLVEDGSRREDLWGADWIPAEQAVRFGALINIRPRVNPSMEIQDQEVCRQVEAIIRKLLRGAS